MRDISLHLLDIVQNSIRAQARLVKIVISLDAKGILTMMVEDDGIGMDSDMAARAQDPFQTTRTERKVGLGLSLLKENAEKTGGGLHVASTQGKGTTVTATFCADHIDCLPMGDLAGTILALVVACPDTPDFDFCLTASGGEASLDTRQIRNALGGVPLNAPEVTAWMGSSLREEIQQIFGGTEYEIHR